MYNILALSQHSIRINRIKDAFSPPVSLKILDEVRGLHRAVNDCFPDLIILDLSYCEKHVVPLINLLRNETPYSSIVLYLDTDRKPNLQSVLEFGRAGASELLIYGFDDTQYRMRSFLTRTSCLKSESVKNLIIINTSSLYIKRYVKRVFTSTAYRVSVESGCEEIKVSRQHIARECKLYNLPTPEWIAGLPRLIRLCEFIDRGIHKRSFLANELEFSSTTGMKHHIKIYLGTDIETLMQCRAYEWLFKLIQYKFNILSNGTSLLSYNNQIL